MNNTFSQNINKIIEFTFNIQFPHFQTKTKYMKIRATHESPLTTQMRYFKFFN